MQKVCAKPDCRVVAEGRDEIEAFFKRTPGRRPADDDGLTGRSDICEACEGERDKRVRNENKWLKKATDTRKKHSERLGMTIEFLRDTCGWVAERMAGDAEHAYAGSCPECARPYESPKELSLDITIRESSPDYGSNTRWMCSDCNSKKRDTPMRIHIARQIMFRKWKNRPGVTTPWQGTLLEGTGWAERVTESTPAELSGRPEPDRKL